MADPGSKLCPQCGHAQAGGEFCEVCGTRLAAAAGAGFSSPAGTGGPVPPPVAGGGPAAPPPYAQYQQPMYGGGYPGSSQPGFFARLFDFSFETFITPTIIKALFILYLVVVAEGAEMFSSTQSQSGGQGGEGTSGAYSHNLPG